MAEFSNENNGTQKLKMGTVSEVVTLKDFKETVKLIHGLTPANANHGKFGCFGIVPCAFEKRPHPYLLEIGADWEELDRDEGVYYRKGRDEIDSVPFIYIDIDNNRPDRKPIKLAKITKIIQVRYGWNFGCSTTFSHSSAKDKFRLIIETDRDATRAEIHRIAIYLNETLFGGQADTSIYDAADFILGPSFHSKFRENFGGTALKVDDLLHAANKLIASKPHLLARSITVKDDGARRTGKPTNAPVVRDMSVRSEIRIANRDIFNPIWIEAYQTCDSHWKTLRSIMGSIWLKTEGGLTCGEMDALLRQVDASAENYFSNKYGEHGIQAMLAWVFTLPTGPANDDWKPLLSNESVDLVIDVKEAACGEGKTYSEFTRMLNERGQYIFASPKIVDNRERAREFRREAKKHGVKFNILIVDSDTCRVDASLGILKKEKLAEWKGRPTVIFMTHLGLMRNAWDGWEHFEAIIDEAADVYKSLPLDARGHHAIIKEQLAVKQVDGDCYRLRLTKTGRLALKNHKRLNDYERLHLPILQEAKGRNRILCVKREQWDLGGHLDFFSLFTPINLGAFKSVRLMSDEALKSPLVKIWAVKWGVVFKPVSDFVPRARSVSTDQRVVIKYFSESKNASKKLFIEDPGLLKAVSNSIKADAGKARILWTANLGLKDSFELTDAGYITPKSHGRNDLQHFTNVAWLAAMRPNPTDKSLLGGLCGMSEADIIEWREHNSMYQAVMRTNLRVFDSHADVTIYVFSKKQAEYLHMRLGGQIISLAHTLPVQHAPTVAQQPDVLTDAQRKTVDRWAKKMIAAGCKTWAELAETKTKRNVDPALIPLIQGRADKHNHQ